MSNVTRTKTKGKVLVDPVWESPVDQYLARSRQRTLIVLAGILLIAFVVGRWLI